jgi:hypothetical protein
MMNKDDIVNAMKADRVPAGWSGLWYITKTSLTESTPNVRHEKPVILPPGTYTFLYRLTDATLYCDPPGEVVMEDTPFELKTHLGFVMQARGRVLVTGLGLGCVVRGLLANPAVEYVTCVENSKDVLKLVEPHMPKDRLTIVEADALTWTANNKETFDCAWHDLWTDRSQGEPHLDLWHLTLLHNCRRTVKQQGAWAFDKQIKKCLLNRGFQWMG